jgi:hypothetical protein
LPSVVPDGQRARSFASPQKSEEELLEDRKRVERRHQSAL